MGGGGRGLYTIIANCSGPSRLASTEAIHTVAVSAAIRIASTGGWLRVCKIIELNRWRGDERLTSEKEEEVGWGDIPHML